MHTHLKMRAHALELLLNHDDGAYAQPETRAHALGAFAQIATRAYALGVYLCSIATRAYALGVYLCSQATRAYALDWCHMHLHFHDDSR